MISKIPRTILENYDIHHLKHVLYIVILSNHKKKQCITKHGIPYTKALLSFSI